MKKSIRILVWASLALVTSLAWADDAHHPAKDPQPAATSMGGQEKMQMGKMQEKMLQMHEQMHKIMQAKTPAERDKLMQEHAKMMQEHMHMMHGMKGGMMEGGMGGKMERKAQ